MTLKLTSAGDPATSNPSSWADCWIGDPREQGILARRRQAAVEAPHSCSVNADNFSTIVEASGLALASEVIEDYQGLDDANGCAFKAASGPDADHGGNRAARRFEADRAHHLAELEVDRAPRVSFSAA